MDKVRRDRVAMAGVLSLGAVNAPEGRLAAEYVSTGFWAPHCQRMAFERESDFDVVRKCLMQAASRMREGKSALRMLKLQERRKAIEADNVAARQAEWLEHCALRIMAEVLSDGPLEREEADAGSGGGLDAAGLLRMRIGIWLASRILGFWVGIFVLRRW